MRQKIYITYVSLLLQAFIFSCIIVIIVVSIKNGKSKCDNRNKTIQIIFHDFNIFLKCETLFKHC